MTSTWDEFGNFCADRGLTALPATDRTVLAYAQWVACGRTPGGVSAVTVRRHLDAIAAAHRDAGLDVTGKGMAPAREFARQHAGLGAPRGPGRPRQRPHAPTPPDALTAARDAALGALMAGKATSVWLASLRTEDVRTDGGRVEMHRSDVSFTFTISSGSAAAATAAWLEALEGEGIISGPLFPRIAGGRVAGEPLLAGEIAIIAGQMEAATA